MVEFGFNIVKMGQPVSVYSLYFGLKYTQRKKCVWKRKLIITKL